MRKVFSDMSYIDDFQFDSQNSLVYVATKRHRGEDKGNLKQLKRCRSCEEKSQIVWEREEAPLSAEKVNPLIVQSSVHVYKLSPDTQTLFISCIILDQMQMELIDSATGTTRGKCSIQCVVNQNGIFGVQSVFTSDSKNMVIETKQTEKEASHHYWCWIDVQTGQQVKLLKVPEGIPRYSFISSTSKTPISLCLDGPKHEGSTEATKGMLLSIKDQIEHIKLSEIIPPEISAEEKSTLCVNLKSLCLPDQHLMVTFWNYFTYPSQNGPNRIYHPERWCIRDLKTGELVNTGNLPFSGQSPETAQHEFHRLVGLLPGPYLMLENGNSKAPGYFEEFLLKLHGWLGLSYEKLTRLIVIDGKTSDVSDALRLPGNGFGAYLLESGSKLLLINNHNDKFNVHLYDFPLHQPWFIITARALGIGLAITLLLELANWRRRRRLPNTIQK